MMHFEDYIDGAEALPDDLQRSISILKEAEAVSFKTSQKLYKKVDELLQVLNGKVDERQGKEAMFKKLDSLFSKSIGESELLRNSVIAMDQTVERRLKKMTADLEKIEELYLEPVIEEEIEAPAEPPPNAYLQQFQQKAATSRKTMFRNNNTSSSSNTNALNIAPGLLPGFTASNSKTPVPYQNSPNPVAVAPSPSPLAQQQAQQQAPGQSAAQNPGQPGGSGPLGQKKRKDLSEPSPSPSQLQPGGPLKKAKMSQPELSSNLPVFNGRGPPPPLCGPTPAAPDFTLKKGDAVAARTSKPRDSNPEWILATVVRHYAGRNRYEVEDVEEEEVSDGKGGYVARKKYMLSADAIIPLPTTLPDPSKKLEFPAEKKVLALYPGTTCFYEATVMQPPSKRKKENDYLVQFEDDEESESPMKAIPQMFVLNMPSDSRSGSPS